MAAFLPLAAVCFVSAFRTRALLAPGVFAAAAVRAGEVVLLAALRAGDLLALAAVFLVVALPRGADEAFAFVPAFAATLFTVVLRAFFAFLDDFLTAIRASTA
ncbi:MAG TPA: hypothetical protein VLT59_13515 [Steroidobacteraceae bacterium]|nr:hypothetical protein [Steroidobacteraceae bacterium]